MNQIRIIELDLVRTYPSDLSELNPAQWLNYCGFLWEFIQGKIDIIDFKVRLLYDLVGIEPTNKGGKEKELNIARLLDTLNGFFVPLADNNKKLTVDTGSVVNLLPKFEWAKRKYKGPAVLLSDITFGTFLLAYQVYGDYCKTENLEALSYLVAVLYNDGRPLPEREKALEKVPVNYALATFFFFRSCVNHITSHPLLMYGQEIPVHEIFQDPDKSERKEKSNPLGLETILFDLGENGVFGNVEELKKQNLFEVLRFLWRKHQQGIEDKKKADAQRTKP